MANRMINSRTTWAVDVLRDMHDALKQDRCGRSTLILSREDAELAYWWATHPATAWNMLDSYTYARKHFSNPDERNIVVNCEPSDAANLD